MARLLHYVKQLEMHLDDKCTEHYHAKLFINTNWGLVSVPMYLIYRSECTLQSMDVLNPCHQGKSMLFWHKLVLQVLCKSWTFSLSFTFTEVNLQCSYIHRMHIPWMLKPELTLFGTLYAGRQSFHFSAIC